MICPDCNGKKTLTGLACGHGRSRILTIDCSTCKGTGEISEQHAEFLGKGRTLRCWRVENTHLSQRDMARHCGLTPFDYSKIEHGDEVLWAQYGDRVEQKVKAWKEDIQP